MQVEGFTNQSDGRLTTSLIAPITNTPPPKFVLLGSEQRGNGQVRYRVGLQSHPTDQQDLRAFKEIVGHPLANGRVPVMPRNEHLHLYGRTHDEDKNPFAFHFVIENEPDGVIAADIAAIYDGHAVGHLTGFVSEPSSHFADQAEKSPLASLQGSGDNVISLRTRDGRKILLNLGVLDELVVDCGVIDKVGDHFQTRRDGSVVKIYSREEIDPRVDPFGIYPIETLETNPIASSFSPYLAPVRLNPGIAAGFVPPVPAASNSGRSI